MAYESVNDSVSSLSNIFDVAPTALQIVNKIVALTGAHVMVF